MILDYTIFSKLLKELKIKNQIISYIHFLENII